MFQSPFLPSATSLFCHWPLPGAITFFLGGFLICFLSSIFFSSQVITEISLKAYDEKHIQQETGIVRKDFISTLKGKMMVF